MFSWKVGRKGVEQKLQWVYALEALAILLMLLGFSLVWWQADRNQYGWHLFERGSRELLRRDPRFIGQALMVLWLLWPAVLVSGVRSFTGLMVQPVSFRWLAQVTWAISVLPLAHYYLNYRDGIPSYSPLREGTIGPGFWVTAGASAALGILLLLESLIREPEIWGTQQPPVALPAEDAQELWQGRFLACPVCGALNDPDARTCVSCRSLLFNFEQKEKRVN